MRRNLFAPIVAIVVAVALLYSLAMLARSCWPSPAAGVPLDRFTAKERGPSLEDAIRAMGDNPENAIELPE